MERVDNNIAQVETNCDSYEMEYSIANIIEEDCVNLYSTATAEELHGAQNLNTEEAWKLTTLPTLVSLARELNCCKWTHSVHCNQAIRHGEIKTSRRRSLSQPCGAEESVASYRD